VRVSIPELEIVATFTSLSLGDTEFYPIEYNSAVTVSQIFHEAVVASESAPCGARNCFLKLLLSSPYLGTQKRCLLKLQRAPSEPERTLRGQSEHLLRCGFSPSAAHGTKNSPYDHTFWRPFRFNSIPRFFLWPPSFSSRRCMSVRDAYLQDARL
jgi:hypothetical protein